MVLQLGCMQASVPAKQLSFYNGSHRCLCTNKVCKMSVCHLLTCLPAGALVSRHRAVAAATMALRQSLLKVAKVSGRAYMTAEKA